MKRTLLKIVPALLVLGLILASCTVPNAPIGGPGSRATFTFNGVTLDTEKDYTFDRPTFDNGNHYVQFTLKDANGTPVAPAGNPYPPVFLISMIDPSTGQIVGYTWCGNADIDAATTYRPVLVTPAQLYGPTKAANLQAALTYIANNYGSWQVDHPQWYMGLVQGVIWYIVNGYTVVTFYGDASHDDMNNPETIAAYNDVLANYGKITAEYDNGISIIDTDAGVNGNMYGPYSVSVNSLFPDMDYTLTVDQGNATIVDADGNALPQVAAGIPFYVKVADGATGDFHFTAKAAPSKDYFVVDNLLLWYGTSDAIAAAVNPTAQPLFQPLFQPLLGTETKSYFYTCGAGFNVPPTEIKTLGPAQSSVTATNMGNIPAIKAGLNPKNGNAVYQDKTYGTTPFVVPNSNHFVYAVLNNDNLVDGVWPLQFVVGNDYQVVGTGFVKQVGDTLEITINGQGSFGALAFTSVPTPKNGNIQSLTKPADTKAFGATAGFSFNSQKVIPCPAGNGPIYLYIDCDSFQFYK